MTVWHIRKIRQNPFNEVSPTDPQAHYMFEVSAAGSEWTSSSGIEYHKLEVIMKYLNVYTPSELVGYTFENDADYATTAMEIWYLQALNGGTYTPPPNYVIRYRVTEALANMTQPDFSDVDGTSVFNAFADAWDDSGIKPIWFEDLQLNVAKASNNTVILALADKSEFSVTVHGQATYAALTDDKGNRQLLILGRSSTPASFVEPRRNSLR